METLIKILVVEDEMLIGAKISMLLTAMGYEVTGILPRGEDALVQVEENKPDIILLDINLKGRLDGIETAAQLKEKNIPIIYLTANSDDATFNRAKETRPAALISKPFKQLDLQRAIELTISRMAGTEIVVEDQEEEKPFILSDRIFVRHKERMIKLMLPDVLYIEADRNYSRIFTRQKDYLLSITLKTIAGVGQRRGQKWRHRRHGLRRAAHLAADATAGRHHKRGQQRHASPVSVQVRQGCVSNLQ